MEALDGFSGAVLVTRGGSTLVRAAAGMADVQASIGCTPDTRFQIASVSKQFTAAAVMLLVESGVLSLAEPITAWLPDTPAHWRHITLHQLLTHTSGLGHWRDVPGFDDSRPGTSVEFLAQFAAVPLHSAPGSAWRYSSPGFLLAALIVQQGSGQRYPQFLAEQIFGPLGMTGTSAGRTPASMAAHGYHAGQRVDSPDFAAMPGAGDVWSTVDDLARYTAAFNGGKILDPRSRQAMCTPHAPVPAGWATADLLIGESYGYGYALGTVAGRPARFHPGDNPGYLAVHLWLPDHDIVIALLSNDETSLAESVLQQLVSAALDR